MNGDDTALRLADSLVAREHNPAVLPRLGKPDVVCGASGELLGVSHDGRACVTQLGHDGEAVERLVEKEGERVRPP